MLHTTALGLGNRQVADVAERYLTDYAGAIERINEVMPGVVARELAKDGHQMDDAAVGATRKMVAKAWHAAGQGVRRGWPRQPIGVAPLGPQAMRTTRRPGLAPLSGLKGPP
jgi:hypothetical protein